jgi:hypothetical protein
MANPNAVPTCGEVLIRPEARPCSESLKPAVPATMAVTNVRPKPKENKKKPGSRSAA